MHNPMDSFLQDMAAQQNPEKALHLMRFFKTGAGEYGEGDVFWGLTVPQQHKIAAKWHKQMDAEILRKLLQESVHEVRLTTLLMMVLRYKKAKDDPARQAIVELYLTHLERVNNWDLVDASAPGILGDWCLRHGWKDLLAMARRDHLWTQRVAIVSTQAMIRANVFEPTLAVADILLEHPHDLIHKAVGWMIREVGNREIDTELNWLKSRYKRMPRTMLRYAIEKFPEGLRQDYLKGRV